MGKLTTFLIISVVTSYIVYFKLKKSGAKPRFEQQQQIEITSEQDNLFPNGSIKSEGWARKALWTYKREYIKSFPFFIKEWDYYVTYIEEKNMWIATTMADIGYANMTSVSVIDCNLKNYTQLEEVSLFPFGKMNLSRNSLDEHENVYQSQNLYTKYIKKGNRRFININSDNFVLPSQEKGLSLSFELIQPDYMESINIQTTWSHDRSLFYLNEKVNGMMPVRGFYKIGDHISQIMGGKKIFTTLDWGRGVWAYEGTWYWGSANGIIDGHKIGFNLGYGFTDRSPATENCIFYEDRLEKLNVVKFELPKDEKDFGKLPWGVKSDDGRVDLKMIPEVDRKGYRNYLVFKTNQHQVFGVFEGSITLIDGRKIEVRNLHGFIEKVFNRW